ncbi:MAG: GntR family transcriptional regulator [Bryobacteraceae bacterium]|nr:GntR family transcriptional regulator [Bryobacteraceae bacterium]
MQLTRIKQESATDAVHTALKQAILSSVLRPGERLNVHELADQLGVSLTPVRNAVQLLEAEGLVEVRPRSGTFVASVSAEDVRETFAIRRALECLAIEEAATALTNEELTHLRDLFERLRRPLDSDEAKKQHELDNAEFHLTILRAARNRKLLEMYQALNAHIRIARIHAGETTWEKRLQQEQREHQAILRALTARDPERAVAAMRDHIDRSGESMLRSIAERK